MRCITLGVSFIFSDLFDAVETACSKSFSNDISNRSVDAVSFCAITFVFRIIKPIKSKEVDNFIELRDFVKAGYC